jgi:hypothetical protein
MGLVWWWLLPVVCASDHTRAWLDKTILSIIEGASDRSYCSSVRVALSMNGFKTSQTTTRLFPATLRLCGAPRCGQQAGHPPRRRMWPASRRAISLGRGHGRPWWQRAPLLLCLLLFLLLRCPPRIRVHTRTTWAHYGVVTVAKSAPAFAYGLVVAASTVGAAYSSVGVASSSTTEGDDAKTAAATCGYVPMIRRNSKLASAAASSTSARHAAAPSAAPVTEHMEDWRVCVEADGALQVYSKAKGFNITRHSVDDCFERCRAEPLCTVFEAAPHPGWSPTAAASGRDGGGRPVVEFCRLWQHCAMANTRTTGVSLPILTAAFRLTGACLQSHLITTHADHAGVPASAVMKHLAKMQKRMNGASKGGSGSSSSTDTEAWSSEYDDPRFLPPVADILLAAWPGPGATLDKHAKSVTDLGGHLQTLCREIVGSGDSKQDKHCIAHFADVAAEGLKQQLIANGTFSVGGGSAGAGSECVGRCRGAIE